MAHFEIQNLSFSYPTAKGKESLHEVNAVINKGEYVVLCGKSGSGKTTLLRQLKSVLAPHGKKSGEILFNGTPIEKVSQRDQSAKIGYVMQNPDDQIVTDKVWHELAFGLESLGCDQKTMRARVAEMACYFGIQDWFHRDVANLSGGEQQRAALAKVLLTQPKLLLLDEPTKGIDSFFKETFATILAQLKAQGITIVMVSHDVEFCAKYADMVSMFFDGQMLTTDTPRRFFGNNSFYTTAANRMSRHVFSMAVTAEDVVELYRQNKEAAQ